LLNGTGDENKEMCLRAVEDLFTLVYKRCLTGKVDNIGITIHPVIREAVQKFNVPAEDIIGPKRSKSATYARLWVARKLRRSGMSYPQIGKILNRNHTTIMTLLGAR
jgi:chromosomal replication initiation ATPase DnaA